MKYRFSLVLFCLLYLCCFELFGDSRKYYKIYQKIEKASHQNDTSLNDYFLKLAQHKNAKSWNDYTLKFRIYSYLEMYEQAVVNITKAIEIKPSVYSQYLQKADCYRMMNKFDSALIVVQDALNLDSVTVPVAYYERGMIYYESGRYEDALKDFDKQIRLSNNVRDGIYTNASRVYKSKCNYFLGNFDNAIEDLNFKKSDTSYYGQYTTLERGKIFYTQKKLTEANSEFNAFIRKGRDLLAIGLASAYLGDKEKALNQLLKYTPGSKNPIKNDYYSIARIYAVLNDKENALKYIDLSLRSGYNKIEFLKADYDLENVKNTAEFTALLEKYQTNKQK